MTTTSQDAADQAEQPESAGETASPPSEPGSSDKATGLPRLARLVGTAVAPTTALTALLFYFGWSHAYYFFDYFGLNSTTLGLTTSDYLMRSQDGLFVPLLVLTIVGMVLFRMHHTIRRGIDADLTNQWWRRATWILTAVGTITAATGGLNVLVDTPLRDRVAAAPLTLASGVLLLAYAAYMRRSLPSRSGAGGSHGLTMVEWTAIFMLVGLSLFWAANDYSAAVGRSRASQFVRELPTYPSAILYSERSLNIAAPGVSEIHCPAENAAYEFRYDGLKLILESGGQLVFVPKGWTPQNGVTVVVPRSDSIRLQFVAPAGLRGAGADQAYACSPQP